MADLITFGKRIKELRLNLNITQEELARKTGYTSRSSINKIELGLVDLPQSKVVVIAEALGVTPTYLLFGEESTPSLASNVHPISTNKIHMLEKIASGEPVYTELKFDTSMDASTNINADLCLIANGDSMIGARIYDGDVVFIKKQDIVENGEIAAVIIDDEVTLKRWYYDRENNTLILSPENPAHRPLVYQGEALNSVRCLGKAVSFMSKL